MLAALRASVHNQPRALVWLLPLCLLCGVGVIASIVRMYHLPREETWRANMAVQRVVIDSKTGEVAGLKAAAVSSFDVGGEAPPAPPESAPTETPVPQEATPSAPEPAPPTAETPLGNPDTPALSGSEALILRETPQVVEIPAIQRSNVSLVKAPAPEAAEKKEGLILPRKPEKGLAPSRLYARSFAREGVTLPLLSILVTDVGFNPESVQAILNLPPEISVAISPYAPNSNAIIETLRNAGHEAWIMLPSMTDAYPQDDPGPLGILASQKPEGAVARLHGVLAAGVGTVGIVLPPNEALTPNDTPWHAALNEVLGRGLYVLSTRNNRSLDQIAPDQTQHASLRRADVVLDSEPSTAFIRSKLSSLSGELAAKGDAIVVTSARPQTLEILKGWLTAQQVFTLAPVSAIYRGVEAPPPPPEEKKKSGGH